MITNCDLRATLPDIYETYCPGLNYSARSNPYPNQTLLRSDASIQNPPIDMTPSQIIAPENAYKKRNEAVVARYCAAKSTGSRQPEVRLW
jgi:hypothetical protein